MAKKPRRGAAPRRKAAAGTGDPIIDAAFRLAESRGWADVALRDIAAEAGVPFSQLYGRFTSKQAVLDAFSRQVDQQLLAGSESDPSEGSARDRLFDMVMRRLDLLQPHREALRSIARATRREPLSLACRLCSLRRAMASTLEAAGISAGGLEGCVRVKGLTAIYLSVLRRWFDDDSEDRAGTMAHLDRMLHRVDNCLGRLRWRRGRPREESAVGAA